MKRLILTHWEGAVMALFLTIAFVMGGTLDKPTMTAHDGSTKYASKE
ncbi:hypothetical protein KDH83_30435 [Achromobacter sp. Marseille-Q0513]|nr:hypothetical protein [Achromobacter sp. Marseille-Q0513]MBR8657640.1 hypothetical protein [Achromobacter sp. Marseille-Q0513]